MYMMSIDPGKHGIACAKWNIKTRELFNTEYIPMEEFSSRDDLFVGFEQVVIEKPQVYVRSKSKGDPNDLIDLAFTVGRVVQRVANENCVTPIQVFLYLPRQWKGQIPKPIHHERIWKKLSAAGRANVTWPKLKKNRADIFDSIGIGQYHLERLKIR